MDRGRLAPRRGPTSLAAEQAYLEADDPLAGGAGGPQPWRTRSMLAGDLVTALQHDAAVRAPLDAESELWAAINELDRAAGAARRGARHGGGAQPRERRPACSERCTESGSRPRRSTSSRVRSSVIRRRGRPPSRRTAARRFRRVGSEAWAAPGRGHPPARAPRRRRDRPRRAIPPSRRGRLPAASRSKRRAEALAEHGLARRSGRATPHRPAGSTPSQRSRQASHGSRCAFAGAPLEVGPAGVTSCARSTRGSRGREAEARRARRRGIDLLDAHAAGDGQPRSAGVMVMRARACIDRRPRVRGAVAAGPTSSSSGRNVRATVSQQIVPVRPAAGRRSSPPISPSCACSAGRVRTATGSPTRAPSCCSDRARDRQWSHTGRPRPSSERAVCTRCATALARTRHSSPSSSTARRPHSCWSADERGSGCDRACWPRVRAALRGLRADLDVSASVPQGPWRRPCGESLDDRLSALSALLVDPRSRWSAMPRGSSLTVPGVLAGVPWTMLPALRDSAVTVTPSASRLGA